MYYFRIEIFTTMIFHFGKPFHYPTLLCRKYLPSSPEYFLRGPSTKRRGRYTPISFIQSRYFVLCPKVICGLDDFVTRTWTVGGFDTFYLQKPKIQWVKYHKTI